MLLKHPELQVTDIHLIEDLGLRSRNKITGPERYPGKLSVFRKEAIQLPQFLIILLNVYDMGRSEGKTRLENRKI